jgi:hypothetical protein
MEYNSARPRLIIPEYGRNIQRMIEECMEIEERERRNAVAHAIIEIIGNLNPHLRDAPDYRHKLWDHLFIMSDFQLDVDSPYPIPQRETFESKPDLLQYPKKSLRHRHYGNIIRQTIRKTMELDPHDPEREALVRDIANQMKKSYLHWNKDTVQDDQIWNDLYEMSDGKIKPPEEANLANAQSLTSGLQQQQDRNAKGRSNKRNRNRKTKKKFRKPGH